MQDTQGSPRGSKWCAGCHDHAVFFNGRFEKPIEPQVDTPEARDGIGARVAITSAPGRQWNTVRSRSSYASESDRALVFGLAQDPVVNSIEVTWPSGTKQTFGNVVVNQFLIVDESRGILK